MITPIQAPDMPYTDLGPQTDYYGSIRDNMSATQTNVSNLFSSINTAKGVADSHDFRLQALESVTMVRKGKNFIMWGDGTVMNWGSISVDSSGANFIKFTYPFINTEYNISFGVYSTNSLAVTMTSKGADLCWIKVHGIPHVSVAYNPTNFVTNASLVNGGTPEAPTQSLDVTYGSASVPNVTVLDTPLACDINYIAFGRWK